MQKGWQWGEDIRIAPAIRSECGEGDAILVEPIVVKREYPAQWTKRLETLDNAELGRLRFVEKWTIEQLTKYFNCHRATVLRRLAQIKASQA